MGLQIYKRTYKTYPPTLSSLGGSPTQCAAGGSSSATCLVDDFLAKGEKSGYLYSYSAIDSTGRGVDAFSLTADAINGGSSKQPHYFADQTGIIRIELGHSAARTSPSADKESR
jgi:hypothetical protein